MGMTATPECKESAYWKHKEREEFGGFDYQFFYRHAIDVCYDVTNALFNVTEAGMGV